LIPYECFIDGRDFENPASLFNYTMSMPYAEYGSYREETQGLLFSKELDKFTLKSSIDYILNPIKGILGANKNLA
jgi:hypothetical protein